MVVPTPPAARHHELPVVGLRAESRYDLDIDGLGDLDVEGPAEGVITTGALPDSLPDVVVEADARATPGYTLFNASAGSRNARFGGNLIMVDAEGEVVWYHQDTRSMADVRQLANGNLLFNWDSTGAREIDLLGNVVHEWTTTSRVEAGRTSSDGREFFTEGSAVIDTVRLHHEVAHELPNGNFLGLGMEVRDVEGFDDDLCGADDPLPDGPRAQRGDVVLEFTRSGEVVTRFPLLDAVDPVAVPGLAVPHQRVGAGLALREPGNLIMVDAEGEVVWYHQDTRSMAD
ncbi:MAG: aryl-sulfate sulfotransferase, partial [Actinomycetota bacterium]